MYLNIIQLAESLGVDESVVRDWMSAEGLPHISDSGRLMFDRAQVAAWAASRGLAAKAGFLAAAPSGGNAAHSLKALLQRGGIWRSVSACRLIPILGEVLGRLPGATAPVRQLLTERLHASGGITWAPVGGGVALPHLRVPAALGRESGTLALLFLSDPAPIPEPLPDEIPVRALLFFVAPSPRAHLAILSQLSRGISRGGLRCLLARQAPDQELLDAFEALEAQPSQPSTS